MRIPQDVREAWDSNARWALIYLLSKQHDWLEDLADRYL